MLRESVEALSWASLARRRRRGQHQALGSDSGGLYDLGRGVAWGLTSPSRGVGNEKSEVRSEERGGSKRRSKKQEAKEPDRRERDMELPMRDSAG